MSGFKWLLKPEDISLMCGSAHWHQVSYPWSLAAFNICSTFLNPVSLIQQLFDPSKPNNWNLSQWVMFSWFWETHAWSLGSTCGSGLFSLLNSLRYHSTDTQPISARRKWPYFDERATLFLNLLSKLKISLPQGAIQGHFLDFIKEEGLLWCRSKQSLSSNFDKVFFIQTWNALLPHVVLAWFPCENSPTKQMDPLWIISFFPASLSLSSHTPRCNSAIIWAKCVL